MGGACFDHSQRVLVVAEINFLECSSHTFLSMDFFPCDLFGLEPCWPLLVIWNLLFRPGVDLRSGEGLTWDFAFVSGEKI